VSTTLGQTYGDARANIANSAVDATNALKGQISNAETNLYGLAEQAVDPLTMAQSAQAASGALAARRHTRRWGTSSPAC
jgi:hypothetical protein